MPTERLSTRRIRDLSSLKDAQGLSDRTVARSFDWGLVVLIVPKRHDPLEILEVRHGRASTIVTSQLMVEH